MDADPLRITKASALEAPFLTRLRAFRNNDASAKAVADGVVIGLGLSDKFLKTKRVLHLLQPLA
jgi:hypothetical protein